ncbi:MULTISPECIES: UDP-galactopyranose mutase [Paraburkholderia]|uniref:UDP-galactopyranose mutase n=1 Tax=Paraburkholderia madseniana TaxID=2599607 RepID=A0A6N6WHR2_9BURK|nr:MULTISPECIES: UDP-galactopyranose mutase [Paraburkholderia]KAE8760197.1 UDP-galactopyranose mutase [Paraburkholderia madseniana]MCX4173959.1 UDP-galactopyranose mutase [Paraburkholderia madseniana]MDQ6461963.1 UDP-galactopyranose mutase [Paraburkholderia madseniana]
MKYDALIVGAGFAGAVCAERLAAAGKRVLIIDKRSHIGGNAFDCHDENGVLIHPYGPHIFHTSGKRIFEYLSNFTDWRPYEHRVLAHVDGELYPIPINRTTINRLYDLDLDEQGVTAYLESVREPRDSVATSEDVVLSSVGHDLCEKFFRGYTQKQWGLDLSELSAGVAARIPTRANDDDRYFTDAFQFMPAQGYTSMFEKMLEHPNIEVRLSEDFRAIRSIVEREHTIYTGPIDAYFDFRFGKLPYRSLFFQHEHLGEVERFQQTGTINYPNDQEYTRITEFKHLTGQQHSGTSIVREYPRAEGDPYYPIPRPENEALFKRYHELAEATPDVTFVGRLAQYRYYNMDQVVGAALKAAEELIE